MSLHASDTPDTHHPDLTALLSATLQAAPPPDATPHGAVIALCAQWCGTCRGFRDMFKQAAQQHPGWHFRWLDVEDEADALGDLDIDTFPTLVIGGRDGRVRFAGPVLPQPGHIRQLLGKLAAP